MTREAPKTLLKWKIFWDLLQKSALFTVHERTCTRFTRLSFVVCCSSPCPKYLINPYNAIFLKSQGSKDIKNDILDCQIHKYTNTNTQIHKYTNTAYDKMTEIPNICYIFEQLVVQGCQKWYSGLSDTQIHKYKFTNTQIHKYSIWRSARKTQHVVYFWKEGCSKMRRLGRWWRPSLHSNGIIVFVYLCICVCVFVLVKRLGKGQMIASTRAQ